jgi:O-Antigen ligase
MQRIERFVFYSLILLLPTQLGKHFWPDFTLVSGIRIDYLSPIIYVTDVLLGLLFWCAVFRLLSRNVRAKRKGQNAKLLAKSKKLVIVGIVLLFLLCNCFLAARPLLSLYGLVKLGEFVFFGQYVAQTVKSRSQLQQIALLFSISSICESLLAIAQYIHQGSLNGIFYFFGERTFTGSTPGIANASIGGVLVLRPYGTFPHPNVLAGYLLVSMVLAWSFLLRKANVWIITVGIVSLFLGSTALFLSFSRVAILIWILLLFIILGQTAIRSKIDTITKLIAVIFTFLILAGVCLSPFGREVILRFSQTSLTDESVIERTELLSTAFTMIRQHPLIGVGLYNFIPAMAPLQKPMPLGLYLQPVHNIFVLVTAETGIIGFGLFIWSLVVTMVRIKKQELRIKGTLTVLLLIIFVTGMVDHYWVTLQQGQLLFAIVLGLCFCKRAI